MKAISLEKILEMEFESKEQKKKQEGFAELRSAKKSKINQLVLLPIIAFEIAVCFLTMNYYLEEVVNKIDLPLSVLWFIAVSLAVTVESLYMYCSTKRKKEFLIPKVALLALSIATLSYTSIKNDPNVASIRKTKEVREQLLQKSLTKINKSLEGIEREKIAIIKDMEIYRKQNLITRGNSVLSAKRADLFNQERLLMEKQSKIDEKIALISVNKGKQSKWYSDFLNLSFAGFITIFVFLTIQITICIALPEILEEK